MPRRDVTRLLFSLRFRVIIARLTQAIDMKNMKTHRNLAVGIVEESFQSVVKIWGFSASFTLEKTLLVTMPNRSGISG